MRPLKSLALAAVISLTPLIDAAAEPVDYNLTLIADTRNGVFSSLGVPSLSNNGTVAFHAFTNDGATQGIFTGTGGPTTTIAQTPDVPGASASAFNQRVSINSAGTVAFSALVFFPGVGGIQSAIYTSAGGVLTPIIDSRGQFSGFAGPSINDNGTLAFRASLDAGGAGIFTLSPGGAPNSLLGAPSSAPSGDPSINNSGAVAFRATRNVGTVSESGLFVANPDGTLNTIVSAPLDRLSDPSINEAGTTAFGGRQTSTFPDGTFTGPPFARVGDFPFLGFGGEASINDAGTVAFISSIFLPGGGFGGGIFAGDDPINDLVVGGDVLFGARPIDLDLGRDSLNNAGQIAFHAVLQGNHEIIVLATPVGVPEPGTLMMLSAGLLGLGWAHRRTGKWFV